MSGDCYCVCHSPFSSCAWCEHCKGINEVTQSPGFTPYWPDGQGANAWERKVQCETCSDTGAAICCPDFPDCTSCPFDQVCPDCHGEEVPMKEETWCTSPTCLEERFPHIHKAAPRD